LYRKVGRLIRVCVSRALDRRSIRWYSFLVPVTRHVLRGEVDGRAWGESKLIILFNQFGLIVRDLIPWGALLSEARNPKDRFL